MGFSVSGAPGSGVPQVVVGLAGPWAPVAEVLHRALAEQRLVGAVVLVYQHGQVLCSIAAGWADREARTAMAENTVFRWASVSKPVVSAAVMRLVADGRLGLDEPITSWLPAFRPRLPDGREACISLRQLLSHTAGLGYRFFEADDQGPYAQAGVSDGMDASGIDLQENLRRIASVPLLYEPAPAGATPWRWMCWAPWSKRCATPACRWQWKHWSRSPWAWPMPALSAAMPRAWQRPMSTAAPCHTACRKARWLPPSTVRWASATAHPALWMRAPFPPGAPAWLAQRMMCCAYWKHCALAKMAGCRST